MAQETSKATYRRWSIDKQVGSTFWQDVFHGTGIDVGPGDDPLVWGDVYIIPFDKEQGDANKIDEPFKGQQFDFIHGSQVMEHLFNPADFINRCLRILKPGGWIVMTVPCYTLYEKKCWPSKFNPDHKVSFSLWDRSVSVTPKAKAHTHIFVPEWIKQFNVTQRYANLIDTNFDYLAPEEKDQTWLREDGVEAFIEILLQKHP